MTTLHWLCLSAVTEEELRCTVEQMEEDRRERVRSMRHALRQRQTVAGELLARRALAELSGSAVQDIRLSRTAEGKPVAREGFVSIAHSGEWVVCAVSPHPVGVDVERLREIPPRVAARFLSEQERRVLAEADDARRCFWGIWTGKEALAKCTGLPVRRCESVHLREEVTLHRVEREGCIAAIAEWRGTP